MTRAGPCLGVACWVSVSACVARPSAELELPTDPSAPASAEPVSLATDPPLAAEPPTSNDAQGAEHGRSRMARSGRTRRRLS